MDVNALAQEMNELLARETRSLARHLEEAPPRLTARNYHAWRRIRQAIHTDDEHANRLTDLIEQLQLPKRPASFGIDVARFHYQTLESLLPLLIQEKQEHIAAYERAIEHVTGHHPQALAELTDLLADNRRQLEVLQSCANDLAAHSH